MDQKIIGTVISVKKQWWLKVNTKPVRMCALDTVVLIVPIFFTEKALNKTFDKDGKRKAE